MEKFLENLQEAEKIIRTLNHLIYVTLPLIKDKRLQLKILLETKTAVAKCINSILQYEYLYKKINLYTDPKTNFRIFQEKCAPKYKITKQEIKFILELFNLVEKHKQSPFEFIKDKKVVILSEKLKVKTITVKNLKEFLVLAKSILRKTRETMKNQP